MTRDELEELLEQKANLEYLLTKVSGLSPASHKTYSEMLERIHERIAAINADTGDDVSKEKR